MRKVSGILLGAEASSGRSCWCRAARPSCVPLAKKRRMASQLVVDADGEHAHVGPLEAARQVLQRRHLLDAGRAPGGPEVQQHRVAALRAQRHHACRWRRAAGSRAPRGPAATRAPGRAPARGRRCRASASSVSCAASKKRTATNAIASAGQQRAAHQRAARGRAAAARGGACFRAHRQSSSPTTGAMARTDSISVAKPPGVSDCGPSDSALSGSRVNLDHQAVGAERDRRARHAPAPTRDRRSRATGRR